MRVREDRARVKEEKRKEMADLLLLPRPAENLHKGVGFSSNTRSNRACQIGKGGLSATKQAVGKDAKATFAKRKSR